MGETLVCCCGVSCWTRFIGWFQLIGSTISFWVLIICLTLIPWETTVEFSKVNMAAVIGFSLDFQKIDPDTQNDFLYTYLIIVCSMNLVSILTAYTLLKGSYQKKPKYILPWIIVKIADTILTVGLELGTCVAFMIERDIGACVLKIVYFLIINGLIIYMVAIHKLEIEASMKKVRPAVGEIYRI